MWAEVTPEMMSEGEFIEEENIYFRNSLWYYTQILVKIYWKVGHASRDYY